MPIETTDIFTSQLPVGETLRIQRTRFRPETPVENAKRISIVSGIHGDELEGQLVIYLLAAWLREHPEALRGTVDIYPDGKVQRDRVGGRSFGNHLSGGDGIHSVPLRALELNAGNGT